MEYFEIAPRNVSRARICLTIERYRGQMGSEGEPRDAAGNPIKVPPDNELLRFVQGGLLLPQKSSPALDPRWNTVPRGANRVGIRCPKAFVPLDPSSIRLPNPTVPQRDAKAPPSTQPDSKAPLVAIQTFHAAIQRLPPLRI